MSAGRADIDTNTLRGVISQLKSLARTLEDLVPSVFEANLPKTQRIDYLCRSRSFADGFVEREKKKKKGGAG